MLVFLFFACRMPIANPVVSQTTPPLQIQKKDHQELILHGEPLELWRQEGLLKVQNPPIYNHFC